jgi:hypothetical protein
MWFNSIYELDKLIGWVTFDVKLSFQNGFQVPYVRISDVPFVWTWMYGDAFGPKTLAVQCHLAYIGHIASSGVADGGYFIDVYA